MVLHLGRGGAGGELRGGEQERGLHALLREGGGHLITELTSSTHVSSVTQAEL